MLIRDQRVVGVLNVHSRRPRAYAERDLALLTGVADLLALAVEHARLYERLGEREAMLERFAARSIEAQEVERRRLAGEIHDGISQRLISLWYHLSAADDASRDSPTARRELNTAKGLASAALDETRTAIAALRPSVLDDLGLGPSLESLARSVPGLEVELDIGDVQLPPHVEVALFRIAQEALQNVVKHARASRVRVEFGSEEATAHLRVRDDGCGFVTDAVTDLEARLSYGMVGMRERAELIGAQLAVTSALGAGTTVEVVVPLSGPSRATGPERELAHTRSSSSV
jgi:signal transduction histidine kinase